MFNKQSDYALNKLDKDAIVCPSATGVHIRLTRESFDSEEEFLYWKALSDGDYLDTETSCRDYYDNCIRLTTDQSTGESIEDVLLAPLLKTEQAQQIAALLNQAKALLTKKQYRRLWMLHVEGMSVDKIAAQEGVTPQAIYACFAKAEEVIVNNL